MREALERDSGRGNLRDTLRERHSGERQSEIDTQREALRERGTRRDRHVQTVVDRSVSRSCASESRGECVRNLPIGAMG